MNGMNRLFLLLMLLSPTVTWSQVITVTPVFPTVNDSVTIIFNAAAGNAQLQGEDTVYIHTGLITGRSTQGSDWHYRKRLWSEPDSVTRMENLGNNLHRIKFKMNNWYGFNSSEKVRAMAMVFRNYAGTQVGTNTDGSDIFVPVYGNGFSAVFTTPVTSYIITGANQSVPLSVQCNQPAFINIFLDGNLVAQEPAGNSLSAIVNSGLSGKHWVKMVAESGVNIITDSVFILVQPQQLVIDPPAGTGNGITMVNDSTVILCLLAPQKNNVFVIGDFNDWQVDENYFTHRSLDGERFWLQISGLVPGNQVRFQYLVDNKIRIADPNCEMVLDPSLDASINPVLYPNLIPYPSGKTYELVSVMKPGEQPYNWQVTNFQKPDSRDLVIYELLIRDFAQHHTFQTVKDSLNYLKKLGINAIELMPVTEFDGNESWGYGPNFFFAVDKTYGPREKLKELIDAAHQNGMAVILDIVLNHAYGLSPLVRLWWNEATGKPAANSPYFNQEATHPYSVGYDFNHDSPYTRAYVDTVLAHWCQEYKIDGFRFDLSKGFTQTSTINNQNPVGDWSAYDASRIYNIQRFSNLLWQRFPGTYIILEHLSDNSEETVLANSGCLMWGKGTTQYNQATMGWNTNWDFEYQVSYQARGWAYHNLVGYMESHDEERLMYNNRKFGNGNTGYSTKGYFNALERMEQAAALFIPVPGPKMIWMFGELGYDYSINWPTNTDVSRTAPKPVRWDYLTSPARVKLYKTYAALNDLKTSHTAFRSSSYDISAFGTQKQLYVNDATMNCTVFGNFDIVTQDTYTGFQHTGTWYNYFTGQALNVTDVNMTVNLPPGKFRVYTDVQLPVPDMSLPDSLNTSSLYEYDDLMYVAVGPNPFSDNTSIRYFVDGNQMVNIAIYDLTGRIVKNLVQENQSTGIRQVQWDATNQSGARVLPGNYYYRITSGTYTATGKLVYIP